MPRAWTRSPRGGLGSQIGPGGKLRCARVTASHGYPVGAVVCVNARDMKEPWCLEASDAAAPAGALIKQYARRWTIEPSFRDILRIPADSSR